ncbi:uncharacterized protein LOC9630709 [Selaginella moellendorffii]|uniref:uncharacterized protein LOC9630709 n=1 Tax=Selaginella moellendorffii TaxID=88036 RepID=UPI000D1C288D|nr:uncharacterized protein LOC9630709 [Selaginella moellendorffii]|eukprot:XP_024534976.1 uncharacterized protein LOC9630709 [Selaginella moellendorffii]
MAEKELLRRFLEFQERRATIYTELQRGFADYLRSNAELAYKELCGRVTVEFNECSRQVLEIEAALRDPACSREDLAVLLQAVQSHEKKKLQMTATLQILKRAGHPSERQATDQRRVAPPEACNLCCTPAELDGAISGLEECQAEAEYLAAHKEAVTSLQEAVLAINELVETVRSEMDEE